MVVIYLDGFNFQGTSSDTKPTPVSEGTEFNEVDTQKDYVFSNGQWKEKKSGSGIWSPVASEILKNKQVTLEENVFKSSNVKGFFGIDASGSYMFVPMGTAGLFAKMNAQGNNIEWADPATSGSWDPIQTEVLENKTIDVQKNPIKQTTPASGSILLDNGTRFLPLAKGTNGKVLMIDENGNVVWGTVTGGGGTTNNYYSTYLPSTSGRFAGWYNGGTSLDKTKASGLLDGQIVINSSNTPSNILDTNKGKGIRFPVTSSSGKSIIHSVDKLFMRNHDSYFLGKFITANQPNTMFMGFTSDHLDTLSNNDDDLKNCDLFGIGRRDSDNYFQIISNAGTSNYTATNLPTKPIDASLHTIEIIADSQSNRFGYRIDDFNGTWNYITNNIPRNNIELGLLCGLDSATSNDYNYDIYNIEVSTKLMI